MPPSLNPAGALASGPRPPLPPLSVDFGTGSDHNRAMIAPPVEDAPNG
jgi:hypothetical protein